MLTIKLPPLENAMAVDAQQPIEIHLEHSLVSLSKWEAKYEKPFFGREAMTPEETVAYISEMSQSVFPPVEDWVDRLEVEHFKQITEYINSKQTATTFREVQEPKKRGEIVTNEIIYHWMIQFQIPWEAQHWHVNRLMTLIKICGIKSTKPKRMSKQQQAEEYRRLNAQRRKDLGTSG